MSVGKFVRFCAAGFGALAVAGAAEAADLYGGYKDEAVYIPAAVWQGFYFGGHAGWSWSDIGAGNNILILGSSSLQLGTLSNSNIFGGAQIGYNIQAGNFVLGVETDLGGMDAGASGSFVDPGNKSRILYVSSQGGFYGDITGRAGFSLGNALIYAKAGFAFFTGGVKVSDPYDGFGQNSGTFTGWTVGAGVEYALSPNWSVKGEYQYFDFDNGNFSCCLSSTGGRIDDNITSNTFKIGVNYLVHNVRSPLY
jgi:opacity protein-like surface antigen